MTKEPPPRHLVIGTAGHIDHGKSALVLALTGVDPDRLKEEKRRGITIELGFADVELAPGKVASFVDAPGHERFVRHMVAGATGIEAVLLVVAADQGVQPQTREHLEICSLLRLERGLVAMTKIDLVESDLREVVALELRELLEGTFLETAEIVEVSARSGEGLEELRARLLALFESVPERSGEGIARLPIDRSFVLRGFGSVVTGTLVSGTLKEGEELEVQPGARRGRVRGLQVHHATVAEAVAGRRTAVNLQGLDCEEVPRGSTLIRPGSLIPTRRALARLELLPHAPDALRKGGPVRFHQGTAERAARFRVLGKDGTTLHVELFFRAPTLLALGDRFILRRPAPVDTVGGGVVMDAHPPPARRVGPEAFDSGCLELSPSLRLRLSRAGSAGLDPSTLAAEIGVPAQHVAAELERLASDEQAVHAGPRWYGGESWREIEQATLAFLARFHEEEPLRMGIPRERLRAQAGGEIPLEAWRLLLEGLAGRGKLHLQGEQVAVGGHEVVLDPSRQALADRIETSYRESGLESPEFEETVGAADRATAREIRDLLIARGTLVRIHDGKVFHADALAQLRDKLRRHAESSSTIDVATFKRIAGVTRKHAIPLLEHLDAERTTRRVGNLREILLPRP